MIARMWRGPVRRHRPGLQRQPAHRLLCPLRQVRLLGRQRVFWFRVMRQRAEAQVATPDDK